MKISLFAAIPISKQQTYIMTNFSLTHTNMRAKQHTVVYWLFLSLKLKTTKQLKELLGWFKLSI